MSKKFHGIIPAVLTPFNIKEELDIGSLLEIVDFLVSSKIHGMFILGSTGQGLIMGTKDRKQVAENIIEHTNNNITSIIHIGSNNIEDVIELGKHAIDIKSDAIACVTPHYYKYDEEAMFEYYKKISSVLDIPIFLYNIPQYTGYDISIELMRKLSDLPNIIGIKDSNVEFSKQLQIIKELGDDLILLTGTNEKIDSALVNGIPGCVPSISNAFPKTCVKIHDSVQNKNIREAKYLQEKINSIIKYYSKTVVISTLLETLRIKGLKSGYVKKPLRNLNNKEINELKEILGKCELT